MTVEITYRIDKTFPGADQYQVDFECLTATDIERAIEAIETCMCGTSETMMVWNMAASSR